MSPEYLRGVYIKGYGVSLSSYRKAREIACELKARIKNGSFRLTRPAASLME